MRKIASIIALAGGVVFSGAALAENYYASQFDAGGATSNLGSHMSKPMVVGVGRGTVRERPNAQSKILTTLGRGARVTVVGEANGGGWAHVMVDGLDGYMDFVQLDEAPAQSGYYASSGYPEHVMVVAVDQANLRAQPTDESRLLVSLRQGSPVVVIGGPTQDGWAHVRAGDLDGYMDVVQLADARVQPSTYTTTYPVYQSTYPVYQSTYAVPVTTVYPYGSAIPVYPSNDRVVNSAGGTIHQQPDPQSPLLATLAPGNRVTVVGAVDGGSWLHVVANGVDGYMDYGQLQ